VVDFHPWSPNLQPEDNENWLQSGLKTRWKNSRLHGGHFLSFGWLGNEASSPRFLPQSWSSFLFYLLLKFI
jgi:hypothetical protein